MPDPTKNPDGSSPPSERESLPLRQEEAGTDSGESPERDLDSPERGLNVWPSWSPSSAVWCPACETYHSTEHSETPLDVVLDETDRQTLQAESRAELEGSTADGLSPIYLEGRHRFVTPCHVSQVGLRASQICDVCFGDIKQPVETAIMLSCGHWTTADFTQGERRQFCQAPGCGEWTLIKVERVLVTRYDVRPLVVFEQGTL